MTCLVHETGGQIPLWECPCRACWRLEMDVRFDDTPWIPWRCWVEDFVGLGKAAATKDAAESYIKKVLDERAKVK